MKKFGLLLVGVVLLMACGGTVQPTSVAAVPSTSAPTIELSPSPTPTLIPTSIPTVVATQAPLVGQIGRKSDYRGDVDVRDLYKNIDKYLGWKLTYAGNVLTIRGDSSGTVVQLKVGRVNDYQVIDLFYPVSVSTDGIYEDSFITVWGRPIQMYTITNALGGQVDQPLLFGDYISK